MVASSTYTAPISESTSLRYKPELGARCVSSARRDLCGGCRVTGIPTATKILSWQDVRGVGIGVAGVGYSVERGEIIALEKDFQSIESVS
jgi:hypothetical protein